MMRHQGEQKRDVGTLGVSRPNGKHHCARVAPISLAFAILWSLPVSAQVTTSYSYDPGNGVATITDPRGLVTTYVTDGLGQRWKQTSPDTGTTSFAYDSNGRLTTMTRADGKQTSYDYDAVGRRVAIRAGGQTQAFTYDSCTYGAGRLCAVSDATGRTTYSYTQSGQLSSRAFSIQGTDYAYGYGYNTLGQLTSVTYPDGNQALYSYTRGVVSGVQVKIGGAVYNAATDVTYQPGNAGMTSWTSGNGLSNRISYDMDGRLTSIQVPGVQGLGFGYDAANRIVLIFNSMDNDMTQSFGYDDMSRLRSVYAGADNQAFSYDANGNRTYHVLNGAGIAVSPKPNNNQISSLSGSTNVSYGYDANGNLTSVSGLGAFTYDAFNRLSAAPNATYYVAPEGQRLRKIVGGTTTWFAPSASGALLAERTNGWTDYVWLNGRLIGRINGGQFLAIHADQVGRPEAMTDGNRNVVWRARNFAFDRQVTINHAVPLNLGFPGQYYDAESGLWNNGYRDYSPSLGRYIQSDPIGLAGGVNTYTYVGGNPVMGLDPLGLATVVIFSGATNGNPAGHIALATTGAGLFSYGTIDAYGSSVTNYVDAQLTQRRVSIAVIPYTSTDDEASMNWTMQAYSKSKYNVLNHNCSTAVGDALKAGGIPVGSMTAPGDMFNQVSSLPGVQIFNLNPGDAPPDLSSFNRR